eukprot:9981270-Lingulodinium_polyedra.AAC.1
MIKVIPQSVGNEQARLEKVTRKLQKLEDRCPSRCNGRLMFIKGLIEAVKAEAQSTRQAVSPATVSKIIKESGRRWQQLPPRQQQHFQDEAEQWMQQQETKLAEEKDDLI